MTLSLLFLFKWHILHFEPSQVFIKVERYALYYFFFNFVLKVYSRLNKVYQELNPTNSQNWILRSYNIQGESMNLDIFHWKWNYIHYFLREIMNDFPLCYPGHILLSRVKIKLWKQFWLCFSLSKQRSMSRIRWMTSSLYSFRPGHKE